MDTEPKILLYDIETTHNKVAAFRLLNENMLPGENILQERYVVCSAFKWLGDTKVQAVSVLDDPKRFAKHPEDDYHVVKTMHDVLKEADAIVAHNGNQYDIKYLETRMLGHGLSPLPPITTLDTLKIAKQRFLFNSNRLDYLGQFLGLGRKIHTDNELWLRVLEGDPSAIREMVVYNKQDVILLEKVFLKLRPYMPDYPNHLLFDSTHNCPRCGSDHVKQDKKHHTTSRNYDRFQCLDCGGWYRRLRFTDKVTFRNI